MKSTTKRKLNNRDAFFFTMDGDAYQEGLAELNQLQTQTGKDVEQFGQLIQNKYVAKDTDPKLLAKRLEWLRQFNKMLATSKKGHWDLFFKKN